MRPQLLAAALTAAFAVSASATEPGPNAREAYVERRGLIEADSQCRLLAPSIRAALNVGLSQARGSLLREGWSNTQLRQLEQTVIASARARACTDARTSEAVAGANRAFAQWANAGVMEFPGWERAWIARRAAGDWRLAQHIDAPISAMFGVRDSGDAQRLTLAVSIPNANAAPTSARLVLRDRNRAGATEISLPQRISYGLSAGAPPVTASLSVPATRAIERISGGRTQAIFTFPDTAFRDLLALDPRESVELHVSQGRVTHRLLVEVGDVAAARAFLTLRR